jgi:hypothetical protein
VRKSATFEPARAAAKSSRFTTCVRELVLEAAEREIEARELLFRTGESDCQVQGIELQARARSAEGGGHHQARRSRARLAIRSRW